MHELISGALFDFMGYLTSLEDGFRVSSNDDPSLLLEELSEWAELRGLSLDEPDIMQWQNKLSPVTHLIPSPPARRILEV